MTKLETYEVGSYEWYIKTGMPQDGSFTYKEWTEYMKQMVSKRIESFELQRGQKVKILVGGGFKMMWYTGEITVVSYSKRYGCCIHLKQIKSTKYIDGWKVSQIEFL